jgi:hypothetical protein
MGLAPVYSGGVNATINCVSPGVTLVMTGASGKSTGVEITRNGEAP